ncbi:nucleotidyltransferase domain-containing protein [Plesiomonas shigelloides]|uniref:nucleotidyltransferase family protein n=1 Tax=Plesiomonas shigelloides TaxID=703 RepID=UPI002FCA40DF
MLLLEHVIFDLKEKYSPHTIILYGSRARNEESETSDIDIVCFSEHVKTEVKDARDFHGVYLDAWIYPTDYMFNITESVFRFSDGVILVDECKLASSYLNEIKAKICEGRKAMSEEDLVHLSAWIDKMLRRASVDDLDGHYRRTWLQFELLSIYFEVRGKWFLGHKNALRYLEEHDSELYELFCLMYKNPLDIEYLNRVSNQVLRA